MKDSITEPVQSFFRRNSKRYSERFKELRKSSSAVLKRSSWSPFAKFVDDKPNKNYKKTKSFSTDNIFSKYYPKSSNGCNSSLNSSISSIFNSNTKSDLPPEPVNFGSRRKFSYNCAMLAKSSDFSYEKMTYTTNSDDFTRPNENRRSFIENTRNKRSIENNDNGIYSKLNHYQSDSTDSGTFSKINNFRPNNTDSEIYSKLNHFQSNSQYWNVNNEPVTPKIIAVKEKVKRPSDKTERINKMLNRKSWCCYDTYVIDAKKNNCDRIATNDKCVPKSTEGYNDKKNSLDQDARAIIEGLRSSVCTNLLSDGESDDSSDGMADDDSNCFEKNLENELEKDILDECPVTRFRDVKLRKKNKLDLYIDIENARRYSKKERYLRKIIEEDNDSDSTKSSPSSPRSPIISIDEAFLHKHQELGDLSADSMSKVKNLTEQLSLRTPEKTSPEEWKAQLNFAVKKRSSSNVKNVEIIENGTNVLPYLSSNLAMSERVDNLSKATKWIKCELTEMKKQDQELAKKLIQIRLEIQKLRLVSSCSSHEQNIDNVAEESELFKDIHSTHFFDMPTGYRDVISSSLRQIGLTQMNFSSRRFSLR